MFFLKEKVNHPRQGRRHGLRLVVLRLWQLPFRHCSGGFIMVSKVLLIQLLQPVNSFVNMRSTSTKTYRKKQKEHINNNI